MIVRKIICGLLLMTAPMILMANSLNKVFHHKRGENNLEIGSLALYFAQIPKIQMLKPLKVSEEQEERTFVFKSTSISASELEKVTRDALQQAGDTYSVRVENVSKDGLVKLTVSYNPQKIDIQYDSFESVGKEKGLVFRFFNKPLINSLKQKNRSILSTACAQKKIGVVVDCGHGGSDSGASVGSFLEKDLTFQVGMQVATLLKKRGIQVFLTRTRDEFVPLDERTRLANLSDADLFLSIHGNFAHNTQAAGLETYCLASHLFNPLFSTLDGDKNAIVADYCAQNIQRSNLLAQSLHQQVIDVARTKNEKIAQRKIGHAVTQVLLGAQMPAALIELGFMSNEYEAALLQDSTYQSRLAQGICNGVMAYLKNVA